MNKKRFRVILQAINNFKTWAYEGLGLSKNSFNGNQFDQDCLFYLLVKEVAMNAYYRIFPLKIYLYHHTYNTITHVSKH